MCAASRQDVDGAYALTHGHDHYGQFCGKATLKDCCRSCTVKADGCHVSTWKHSW